MDTYDKEYLEFEDKKLIEFIKNVLAGRMSEKGFQTINTYIPERLAEAIKKIIGLEVTGFGNEIDKGQTEHIWKEHGKNGKADNSMSDIKNIARIGYVIDNFDNVREGKNKSKYKNADDTLAKTIEIQKRIGEDFYYVVEAVPDTKLKRLRVVTAFINKNDTFFEMAVSNNPSRYVQDESQSNVSSSNNIISDC